MKVHIGKQYRRSWFEERRSDGTYAALNPPIDADARRVQQSYISAHEPRSVWPVVAYVAVAVASFTIVTVMGA